MFINEKNHKERKGGSGALQRQVNRGVIHESYGSHEEGWRGSYLGKREGRVVLSS